MDKEELKSLTFAEILGLNKELKKIVISVLIDEIELDAKQEVKAHIESVMEAMANGR
jgi:hypothetical protein